MAQPNFQYEKRQKELAKKKKQEEKRQSKLNKSDAELEENPVQPGEIVPPEPEATT